MHTHNALEQLLWGLLAYGVIAAVHGFAFAAAAGIVGTRGPTFGCGLIKPVAE